MIYSRSALVRNYETMTHCLPGVEFFYAAKANPDQLILRTLADLGCSVDVCSFREMEAALAAGFTPERMIHTHPCKSTANLRNCRAAGLRWFVYDNLAEVDKIVRETPDVNLFLRVATSSGSSNIDLSAKFGCAPADALGLLLGAEQRGMPVRGISFHVGSQCTAPGDFRAALQTVRDVWDAAAERGVPLEMLDIGGGFPAPYRAPVLTLESYCRILDAALDDVWGDLRGRIRIVAEPGRGMCADSATLATRVMSAQIRNGMRWYVIDDGLYGAFSGIVYDHVEFPLLARGGDERPLYPCIVAGPTCDSSDVVARDQELPELRVDELLLVPTMGAYTTASASGFNGLDIPRSVAVD
jgi:ornithine decarboxylase